VYRPTPTAIWLNRICCARFSIDSIHRLPSSVMLSSHTRSSVVPACRRAGRRDGAGMKEQEQERRNDEAGYG
jgi:hypothetical protein